MDALSLALATRGPLALSAAQHAAENARTPDPANFRLDLVNSLWGDKTLTFEKPFLDTLATDFGSGMYLADFINQADPERLRINTWVSQETANKINDLLPAGIIDTTTRAVLVNALHLKFPWSWPFNPPETSVFTRADGTTASASLMTQTAVFPYAEDTLAQAAAIPMEGGLVYLALFVPRSGTSLAQMEASSLATEVQSLTTSMFTAPPIGNYDVTLTMPPFHLTPDGISLKAPLQALGLVDAFSSAANFSGVTNQTVLSLGDVVHKAMVDVTADGAEAAAATAVIGETTGIAQPPPTHYEVNANHPFLFGVYDQPTATWLFLGHVVDPTQ